MHLLFNRIFRPLASFFCKCTGQFEFEFVGYPDGTFFRRGYHSFKMAIRTSVNSNDLFKMWHYFKAHRDKTCDNRTQMSWSIASDCSVYVSFIYSCNFKLKSGQGNVSLHSSCLMNYFLSAYKFNVKQMLLWNSRLVSHIDYLSLIDLYS